MLFFSIFCPSSDSRAQSPSVSTSPDESSNSEFVNCSYFLAKKDEAPVYREADISSGVIRKLKLGEKVCYIGQTGGFAILDWRYQDPRFLSDSSEDSSVEKSQPLENKEVNSELAYIRLIDLRRQGEEPRSSNQSDAWSQAKEHIDSMGKALVPEDVYGPFRPVIDFIHPPTKCRAGKEICSIVEKDLNKSGDLKSPTPSPTIAEQLD